MKPIADNAKGTPFSGGEGFHGQVFEAMTDRGRAVNVFVSDHGAHDDLTAFCHEYALGTAYNPKLGYTVISGSAMEIVLQDEYVPIDVQLARAGDILVWRWARLEEQAATAALSTSLAAFRHAPILHLTSHVVQVIAAGALDYVVKGAGKGALHTAVIRTPVLKAVPTSSGGVNLMTFKLDPDNTEVGSKDGHATPRDPVKLSDVIERYWNRYLVYRRIAPDPFMLNNHLKESRGRAITLPPKGSVSEEVVNDKKDGRNA